MTEISWDDFDKIELRVGEIIAVDEFPEARKPAWKMIVDFGEQLIFVPGQPFRWQCQGKPA